MDNLIVHSTCVVLGKIICSTILSQLFMNHLHTFCNSNSIINQCVLEYRDAFWAYTTSSFTPQWVFFSLWNPKTLSFSSYGKTASKKPLEILQGAAAASAQPLWIKLLVKVTLLLWATLVSEAPDFVLISVTHVMTLTQNGLGIPD